MRMTHEEDEEAAVERMTDYLRAFGVGNERATSAATNLVRLRSLAGLDDAGDGRPGTVVAIELVSDGLRNWMDGLISAAANAGEAMRPAPEALQE